MPEDVVHDPSILNVLEDYVFGFPYNLTYELPNGTWTNRIDYVIADSNSNTFYESGATPYNTTVYEVLQSLYSTIGDSMGMIQFNIPNFEIQGDNLMVYYQLNKKRT